MPEGVCSTSFARVINGGGFAQHQPTLVSLGAGIRRNIALESDEVGTPDAPFRHIPVVKPPGQFGKADDRRIDGHRQDCPTQSVVVSHGSGGEALTKITVSRGVGVTEAGVPFRSSVRVSPSGNAHRGWTFSGEPCALLLNRTMPKIAKLTVPPLKLSGLEPVLIGAGSLFVNIGERTNVTGSKAFARLILNGQFEEALGVARQQVENGAQIIDINMDEAMLDSKAAMVRFLNLIAGEPEIARVPIMIDSSKWEVIEAGLQCIQGKGIVNSISMKEGEAAFRHQAKLVRRYGAAAVVMAFDEKGQADTFARKTEICARAYRILVDEVGFAPEDIIFDPNIFAIATGIEEHDNYAVEFIEATRWIKANLPGAKVSGGVSNVSFSFRGNDPVREAIHTVFLYHAIKAGMDMGIVNAGMIGVYDDLDPELRERVEDVVLNRRKDAGERLVEIAERAKGAARDDSARLAWRGTAEQPKTVAERLSHALVHGITDFIVEDTEAAWQEIKAAGRPAAARDRRAADGRHGHRRRPVRPGQDVPAAGGEVGAGDEAGGRPPAALHRGREAAPDRRRRRGQGQGQDRHRHRQGRRPRHRQEHRHRRPPVQQLRGREHGRDGGLPGHPGAGQGRGRRHHRPVGPDHAEPRGDAARRLGDAARRLLPHQEDPAADRRRDHQPGAHRGEDRAALRGAGRLRARRQPLGRRLQRPALATSAPPPTSPSSRPTTCGCASCTPARRRRRWSRSPRRAPTRRRSTGRPTRRRRRSSSAGGC